jgi:DNA-binding LacI/PurR family transcriptional regulator
MSKTPGKALYKQIYEELRAGIINDSIKGGSFLPSERELCERFGVDRITVRKSLEMLVGDGLVEKRAGVGTMVKEFPLKSLPSTDLKNILFVLPKSRNRVDRITEPFNTTLFYRIERECKARGYSLIYETLGADEDFARLGNGNSISGILLVSKFTDKQYEDCLRSKIPAVVVNNYQDGYVCVDADNGKGAYDAVSYLCQAGHRSIALILGVEGVVVTADRLAGYKRALAEAGIDWRDQQTAQGDWTFGGGVAAMTEILHAGRPLPTAVFAMNDLTAIGAMEAIKEEGLTVPGDISVVGFDNVEQCEYAHPKLTSVHVEINSIAQAAINQLFEKIQSDSSLVYRIVIPPSLVIRKSAGKPRE